MSPSKSCDFVREGGREANRRGFLWLRREMKRTSGRRKRGKADTIT